MSLKIAPRILALSIMFVFLAQPPVFAAREPLSQNLGGTGISLTGPAEHIWVNKKTEIGLRLAPERYKPLIGHMMSLYSYSGSSNLTKPYNNYCALFYVGPPEKAWTLGEFGEITQNLLPGRSQGEAGTEANVEYMRRLLRDGLGYKISSSKARKYYGYLQEAVVLEEGGDSIILALRIKKKGEKTKYVTMSLALVREKLVGTLYYQLAPNSREKARVASLTHSWRDALLASNS